MAQLPIIEFKWQRDPKGYRLEGTKPGSRRIVRNGRLQGGRRRIGGKLDRVMLNTMHIPRKIWPTFRAMDWRMPCRST